MARKNVTARVLFKSSHDLQFESRAWVRDPRFQEFRIGTCHGQWLVDSSKGHKAYVILSVINESPGNGHFDDVLEWFEQSAKRDNYALEFWEIMNENLFKHLCLKRGFAPHLEGTNLQVIKFP